MSEIKNDYETFKGFVNQYPAYLNLARKFQKTPEDILKLLAATGDEILKRSNDELLKTIAENIKTFVSTKDFKLSDNAINSLDNLMNFLKENNKKRG